MFNEHYPCVHAYICVHVCACVHMFMLPGYGRYWCEHKWYISVWAQMPWMHFIKLLYRTFVFELLQQGCFISKLWTVDIWTNFSMNCTCVSTSHSISVTITSRNLHIQKLIFAQLVAYTSSMNLEVQLISHKSAVSLSSIQHHVKTITFCFF